MTDSERSLHLRRKHGYDIGYAVAAHPSTLKSEHERIHQDETAIHLDHTHEESDL